MTHGLVTFNLFAAGGFILGMILYSYHKKFTHKYRIGFDAFAAGILLGIFFFILIPETMGLIENFYLWMLVGFIIFYALEQFFVVHATDHKHCKVHRKGIISVVGIGVHSMIDGFIIGVGFLISPAVGMIAAAGITVHKIPIGMVTFSMLHDINISRTKATIIGILIAFMTLVGALVTTFIFSHMSSFALGILLSISAGNFLYIAASDMIPRTHEAFNKSSLAIVLAGIILLYAITAFF